MFVYILHMSLQQHLETLTMPLCLQLTRMSCSMGGEVELRDAVSSLCTSSRVFMYLESQGMCASMYTYCVTHVVNVQCCIIGTHALSCAQSPMRTTAVMLNSAGCHVECMY
jgi:hypothetical protein